MKRFLLILIAVILVLSTLIKLQAVNNYNFPFTMDQGRDLVDIRQMVLSHTPRLVGPTTSINGVLLGPFWYYFLLPPFLLSGGNPQAIMYWQILWYQISAIILWHVVKRKDYLLASLIAILYLLMPMGFNTGRYFWNANAMPIFTGLYFACFLWALDKLNFKRLFALGLLAGLSVQIEAAFGILFFPFAFLYILFCHSGLDPESIKIKFKKTIYLSIGFFVTILPQIAFEIRHGFIMTKILLAEFTGKGEMLGEKVSFLERTSDRFSQALKLISFTGHISPVWIQALLILGILILILGIAFRIVPKKLHSLYSLTFGFLIFSSAFYLLFPQKLKEWYTLGLCIVISLVVSIAMYSLIKSNKIILKILGIYLIASIIINTASAQLDYLYNYALLPSQDRSLLRNEIADIDWVYQNAAGRGFNAYSYLPSVYDYPYHYLYWWYGTKNYGYQPADVAYLPGMPEYIKDNKIIWTTTKPQDSSGLTFLIVEKDLDLAKRENAWLGNFSTLCIVKESVFGWTARAIMMTKCQK